MKGQGWSQDVTGWSRQPGASQSRPNLVGRSKTIIFDSKLSLDPKLGGVFEQTGQAEKI
jgi:hypothetical protein